MGHKIWWNYNRDFTVPDIVIFQCLLCEVKLATKYWSFRVFELLIHQNGSDSFYWNTQNFSDQILYVCLENAILHHFIEKHFCIEIHVLGDINYKRRLIIWMFLLLFQPTDKTCVLSVVHCIVLNTTFVQAHL